MSMKQRASRPLSTLLYDEESGNNLIRVSIWVDPEDIEIEDEINDRETTIPVKAKKGRTTIYGKIDAAAWKVYMTQDNPPTKPIVPVPTSNAPSFRERMYR